MQKINKCERKYVPYIRGIGEKVIHVHNKYTIKLSNNDFDEVTCDPEVRKTRELIPITVQQATDMLSWMDPTLIPILLNDQHTCDFFFVFATHDIDYFDYFVEYCAHVKIVDDKNTK